MTTTIDIHILQTVPPSNLNRDDSGSPKTAPYGGVRRARVSSQAWKRATREHFARRLDPAKVGVRTLRAAELLSARIQHRDPSLTDDQATEKAAQALEALGLKLEKRRARKGSEDEDPGVKTQYLVFFSNEQLDRLADLAMTDAASKRDFKEAMKGNNGIDLALFGRMVADDAELNVDASVQVAHALSTHAVESEFDFYTAVDDEAPKDETGAGMMGTIEFNSSVLYRYATINVDLLNAQLSDPLDTITAVGEFLRSFVESMPTGKQNTFANVTLPDSVVVVARDDRAISFVPAFEEPATASLSGGFMAGSAEKMARYAQDVVIQYAAEPVATWVLRVGDATRALDDFGQRVTLPELVDAVRTLVAARLGSA